MLPPKAFVSVDEFSKFCFKHSRHSKGVSDCSIGDIGVKGMWDRGPLGVVFFVD